MSRPKIKTALISVFVAIGLIVCSFAAYVVESIGTMNNHFEQLATNILPAVEFSKEMDTALSDLRSAYRDHILAIDDATEAQSVKTIASERERFVTVEKKYEAIITDAQQKPLLQQTLAAFDGFTKGGEKMIALSVAGDDDNAKLVLQNEMRPFSVSIGALLDQIVEINKTQATQSDRESESAYSKTITVTFAAIALIVVVIAGSIWFALSGIARPIQNITAAMKVLAGGNAAAAVPYVGRADEIGDMAAALEVFRIAANANTRLERDAAHQRETTEKQRLSHAEAEQVKVDAMAQATSGLADGLKQLSDGDLSFQLADPFASEFESLRSDFNAAVEQLAETLTAVADATHAIDSGSREISQSSDDLSKRTEQQAAALEETAAALDQITANVQNSSKRADEARSVAIQANASAVQSGTVVANAVNAMQRIEQSSNQIGNIIGVIDEIAFQTNLLALNAGVEAARAGDAGRGFAVVAQEVRELAQRSANAAKEIKTLISASSVEVDSGVRLVSETGQALKTIEGYIVTVNQLMDSIATSAREQSLGLAEVNTAVNQMDQVTQQNAAMVEETTAASATLASEAGRLRELIGRFQLEQGRNVKTTSLRQASAAMTSTMQPAKARRA